MSLLDLVLHCVDRHASTTHAVIDNDLRILIEASSGGASVGGFGDHPCYYKMSNYHAVVKSFKKALHHYHAKDTIS